MLNEDEKRKQSKSKLTGGGGGVDQDSESALQSSKLDRKPIKCYRCDQEGHVIRNCPNRKKRKQYRPSAKFDKPLPKHNATPALGDSDSDDSGANVFAVGLNVTKGDDCWIIDSGASQHMTSNRDLLMNYQEFSKPEPVVLFATEVEEPTTLKKTLEGDHAENWKAAADSEYQSLIENETWELVELPPGRKAITYKWVFKVKHGENGKIDRFKGRLVARGFLQKYGIEFDEKFSPVVRFTSIRALLAFAVSRNMFIHQIDVVTAFLNGTLDEDVYMEQPEGYVVPGKENLVCHLKKSLYGLKLKEVKSSHCRTEQTYVSELR